MVCTAAVQQLAMAELLVSAEVTHLDRSEL